MDFRTKILIIGLFCSCTSNQSNKKNIKPAHQVQEIDLLESFKIDKNDSSLLVDAWKMFIKDLNNIANKSLDTVVCWSCEDHQQGYYPNSDSVSIDSCISLFLLPLRDKAYVWQLLKTNNYDVEIHKRQSEKIGLYCISFPRNNETESRSHLFKHYFYFKKIRNRFLFHGYIFN